DGKGARPDRAAIPARPRRRGDRVKRRELLALAGMAILLPRPSIGQQPKIPLIGYFSTRSSDAETPIRAAFLKELERLGMAVGRDFAIEYRFAEGQFDRMPGFAADLVQSKAAVLVATDPLAASEAKRATSTIPIVFGSGRDPVQLGLVASFKRPGGNAT